MSDPLPPQLVVCPCQFCNGHIEFDASDFQTGETRSAICPHCNLETILFVRTASKTLPATIPQNLPPVLVSPVKVSKPPKTISEVISIVCLVGFAVWTIVCGFGVLFGFLSVANSERTNPVITSGNNISQAAGTVGFMIGMGVWFFLWLFGAVPTFMIWMITRKK